MGRRTGVNPSISGEMRRHNYVRKVAGPWTSNSPIWVPVHHFSVRAVVVHYQAHVDVLIHSNFTAIVKQSIPAIPSVDRSRLIESVHFSNIEFKKGIFIGMSMLNAIIARLE